MLNKNDDMLITNYSGHQLGNYRLRHLLGRGGYASVYLGEHIYLQRLAAIKILRTALSQHEQARFLEEARLLATLSHPRIVRVLEFDAFRLPSRSYQPHEPRSIPFLIMDYVPGGSLRTCYPSGSHLCLEQVVDYISQVAQPLHYAHQQGIIHRDIKPENLLLNAQHEVQLADFGLALLAPTPDMLSLQELAGSLPYSAPEQLRGRPHFASDQYSLAIIAYEWLCGQRPFHGQDVEILMQHVSVPPPMLRSQNPAIPEAVEEVILTALEKKPQKRYANIEEFASALERASSWRSYGFSIYPHPVETRPSSSHRRDHQDATGSFSWDTTFETAPLHRAKWPRRTKEKMATDPRSTPSKSKEKKRPSLFSLKTKKRVGLVIVTFLLAFIMSIGGYDLINILCHAKSVSSPVSPTVQTVSKGDVNFSTNPVKVQGVTIVKNDATVANGYSTMGSGQQVVINYTLQKASPYDPQMTIKISIRGLVSRINDDQAGSAPITLLSNDQLIVKDFTLPGDGFNPNATSFQVPVGLLKPGNNQITLVVSSQAKTNFWIYDLSVISDQVTTHTFDKLQFVHFPRDETIVAEKRKPSDNCSPACTMKTSSFPTSRT